MSSATRRMIVFVRQFNAALMAAPGLCLATVRKTAACHLRHARRRLHRRQSRCSTTIGTTGRELFAQLASSASSVVSSHM